MEMNILLLYVARRKIYSLINGKTTILLSFLLLFFSAIGRSDRLVLSRQLTINLRLEFDYWYTRNFGSWMTNSWTDIGNNCFVADRRPKNTTGAGPIFKIFCLFY